MSDRGTFVAGYIYCDKCAAIFKDSMEYAARECHGTQGVISGFFKDSNHNDGIDMMLSALSEIPLCQGHEIHVAIFWEGDPVRIVRVVHNNSYVLSQTLIDRDAGA